MCHDWHLFLTRIDHEQSMIYTCEKRAKHSYRRALKRTQTTIERFFTQLWSSENASHTDHPLLSREQLEVLSFFKEPYENAYVLTEFL